MSDAPPPGPRPFRKKPVTIEAMPYDGSRQSAEAVREWITTSTDDEHSATFTVDGDTVTEFGIETLEGRLTASPGDWIIRGVVGEFYACKPDVFADTYEPA